MLITPETERQHILVLELPPLVQTILGLVTVTTLETILGLVEVPTLGTISRIVKVHILLPLLAIISPTILEQEYRLVHHKQTLIESLILIEIAPPVI